MQFTLYELNIHLHLHIAAGPPVARWGGSPPWSPAAPTAQPGRRPDSGGAPSSQPTGLNTNSVKSVEKEQKCIHARNVVLLPVLKPQSGRRGVLTVMKKASRHKHNAGGRVEEGGHVARGGREAQ